MHLYLIEAGKSVFDRVFNRDDLLFAAVQFVERRVERRCLARAGRTGHQHHATRSFQGMAKTFQYTFRHRHFVQTEQPGILVEQTHDNRLTVLGRQGRNPNINGISPYFDIEATILRQAFLGNIESGHQLEA